MQDASLIIETETAEIKEKERQVEYCIKKNNIEEIGLTDLTVAIINFESYIEKKITPVCFLL